MGKGKINEHGLNKIEIPGFNAGHWSSLLILDNQNYVIHLDKEWEIPIFGTLDDILIDAHKETGILSKYTKQMDLEGGVPVFDTVEHGYIYADFDEDKEHAKKSIIDWAGFIFKGLEWLGLKKQ